MLRCWFVVLQGDLKPGNVLIKLVQGAPYGRVAKVADFGLSRALNAGQSHSSTRTFGTLNHAPPELLRLGRLSPAGVAVGVLPVPRLELHSVEAVCA